MPVGVVERCTRLALAVEAFVPRCKKSIRSDAVVAVHLLAGAARAAFQTVLVNTPPAAEAARLAGLIAQVSAKELAYVQVGGEVGGGTGSGGSTSSSSSAGSGGVDTGDGRANEIRTARVVNACFAAAVAVASFALGRSWGRRG